MRWFRFTIIAEIFTIRPYIRPTIVAIAFVVIASATATTTTTAAIVGSIRATNIGSSVSIAIMVVEVIAMVVACIIVIVNRTITSIWWGLR